HGVEVVAGADEGVIDAFLGAAAADLDEILLEGLDVAVAQGARVAQEIGKLLHSFEAGGAREGKDQLVVVEDMEDEHIVTAMGEHLENAEERLAVGEQV